MLRIAKLSFMKSILLLICLSFFTAAFSQTKIGVINKQQLLDSLPSRQLSLAQMKVWNINNEKELGAMDSLLVVLVDEYQKNSTTWSKLVQEYQLARISKVQQTIAERQKEIEIELKMIEAESIRKSELTIKEATAHVSTKLLLDLVVDTAQTIYFKEKLDITKAVQVEMLKLDK